MTESAKQPVMVVEDHEMLHEGLRVMLNGSGAEVIRSCKAATDACAVVALSMHVIAEHV